MTVIKQKIIHYFNQGAETYNAVAEVQTYVAKQLAKRMLQQDANTILEIGCGTGLLSQHIVSTFPQADLWLTDISSNMIDTCKQRFADHTRIQWMCLDAESFMLNTTFDLIVSSMTLHWFEDIKMGLNNIIQHLTTGGQCVFALLGESSLYEWKAICDKNDIPAGTPFFPNVKTLQLHFPELTLETEQYQYSYDSAYTFLHSLKQLGARASNANHTPISAGKLRKLLRQYTNDIQITYEIIYGRYTKC